MPNGLPLSARNNAHAPRSPAVMAGIANKVWTMVDFVKMMEREEELLGGRLSTYKPAKKRVD